MSETALTTGTIGTFLLSKEIKHMTKKEKAKLKRRQRKIRSIMQSIESTAHEDYINTLTPQEYADYMDEGLLSRHFTKGD